MRASEKVAAVGHTGGLESIRLSYERVVRERDELAAAVAQARARISRTIETVEDFDGATNHVRADPTESDRECAACWLLTLAELRQVLVGGAG